MFDKKSDEVGKLVNANALLRSQLVDLNAMDDNGKMKPSPLTTFEKNLKRRITEYFQYWD
jgi:hypothetical protein